MKLLLFFLLLPLTLFASLQNLEIDLDPFWELIEEDECCKLWTKGNECVIAQSIENDTSSNSCTIDEFIAHLEQTLQADGSSTTIFKLTEVDQTSIIEYLTDDSIKMASIIILTDQYVYIVTRAIDTNTDDFDVSCWIPFFENCVSIVNY